MDMHTQPREGAAGLRGAHAAPVPRGPDHRRSRPSRCRSASGCTAAACRSSTPKQFDSHYWPTLKPIIEEFWKHGHQTLFYAEGKWKHHFDTFRELPDRSIVFHCDQDDIFEVHRKLHDKFALSGGIPNVLLSFGKPDEVREFCQRVIDEVARDGGYIMDAGAIMQDDTSIENMRVMTEYCREHGVYPAGSYQPPAATPPCELPASVADRQKLTGMAGRPQPRVRPGVCFPWEEKREGAARDHRRPRPGPPGLGGHRRARQHVHLADAAELLARR